MITFPLPRQDNEITNSLFGLSSPILILHNQLRENFSDKENTSSLYQVEPVKYMCYDK